MKKATAGKPTVTVSRPQVVVIPLSQHAGAPCLPLVKPGDRVNLGQKIGDSDALVSAPVHASVSGVVKAIEPRLHPAQGVDVLSIVIESAESDTVDESCKPRRGIDSLGADEIKRITREAGLVGMGGAGFPTAVKLNPPPGNRIEHYLLNGAECEPYLTADHRLMLEVPEEVVFGFYALMKSSGARKGFICIEDNKSDAIDVLTRASARFPGIEVAVLRTKYPQGAEKQIIKAVTGREVPSGGLPFQVGCLVSNVGTAAALARAIRRGLPLIDRVVTVSGAVKDPGNFRVPIGTSFRHVIDAAGGLLPDVSRVIMGGPMMGIAQHSLDVPVIKGTSGIIALTQADVKEEVEYPCIRCSRCAGSCPMGLEPYAIRQYAQAGWWPFTERYHASDCIECGTCSYRCPAKIPLVQWIRVAKAEVAARRRKGGTAR